MSQLCELILPAAQAPSLRRQCALLGLARGTCCYEPLGEDSLNLDLMRRMDELHLEQPTFGSPRLTACLCREGWEVNRKPIRRLMQRMGLEAIYAKGSGSEPQPGHQIYPDLVRDKPITGPNQVWCADITYVPMRLGFMYWVAVMDWWSRQVLSWQWSNTLDGGFCLVAWRAAVQHAGRGPLIANTDQGAQFTAAAYVEAVQAAGTRVSMAGRRRWLDNVFIERLWRSVKHEDIYRQDYASGLELAAGLAEWFEHYNHQRPQQALHYATPGQRDQAPESYGAKPASWA